MAQEGPTWCMTLAVLEWFVGWLEQGRRGRRAPQEYGRAFAVAEWAVSEWDSTDHEESSNLQQS
jgi:hypothetical protein